MMFIFGFFSAMSGQQFFADAPYQLYNVSHVAYRGTLGARGGDWWSQAVAECNGS
jgi:hypothetical protein